LPEPTGLVTLPAAAVYSLIGVLEMASE